MTKISVSVAIATASLILLLLAPTTTARELPRHDLPFGEAAVTAGDLSWRPATTELRTRLVVGGPGDFRVERVFAPGESPVLRLGDAQVWPDGGYEWSLATVSAAESSNGSAAIRQQGSFRVEGGGFVTQGRERISETDVARASRTPSDPVPTDLALTDRARRELAPGTVQALVTDSSNFPSLWLEDTTVQSGGTEDDWFIRVDILEARDEDFVVQWSDADDSATDTELSPTYPFMITNGGGDGIRDDSLVVRGMGAGDSHVGINEPVPGEELHITTDFPSLRLDDNAGTLQVWDIEGNSIDFQVQDVTNGQAAPFLIKPGAPTATLHLAADGDVGIGTSSPQADLHVVGSGLIEGDVALGSSRTVKHEIVALDGGQVLESVRRLALYSWKYVGDPLQALHVGPMAEDVHALFHLGRSEKHLSPADSAGLALAAVQGVDRGVEELRQDIEALEERNADLESQNRRLQERLDAIEARLAGLSPPDAPR